MADADTEISLDALHDAIAREIAAAFPDFQAVEFYRDDESERIPTPACLLEMTEAEPAPEDDSGTGQWPARLRFDARIIMANRGQSAKREIRKAATALATFVHLRRWRGISADACEVIACEPDEFSPHLDKFVVWHVEWVQLVMLGESAWHNDGTIPTDVFYSFTPNVGAENESAYRPIEGGP